MHSLCFWQAPCPNLASVVSWQQWLWVTSVRGLASHFASTVLATIWIFMSFTVFLSHARWCEIPQHLAHLPGLPALRFQHISFRKPAKRGASSKQPSCGIRWDHHKVGPTWSQLPLVGRPVELQNHLGSTNFGEKKIEVRFHLISFWWNKCMRCIPSEGMRCMRCILRSRLSNIKIKNSLSEKDCESWTGHSTCSKTNGRITSGTKQVGNSCLLQTRKSFRNFP